MKRKRKKNFNILKNETEKILPGDVEYNITLFINSNEKITELIMNHIYMSLLNIYKKLNNNVKYEELIKKYEKN